MKFHRYTLVILPCLISMMTLAQTDPSTPPASSVVLAADVFLRSGPGEQYLPVGALYAGNTVRAVSRNENADWIMIAYRRGYGWIRRDLAFWVEDIDNLPSIKEANLTPTILPGSETITPFFPTPSPEGNYVHVNAQSAYVRAGPGRGYLRLGDLLPGDPVVPVGRSEDSTWILIRYASELIVDTPDDVIALGEKRDGFGWVAVNLVRWADNLTELPVVDASNLTPTATFTHTNTPTSTSSATLTPLPSATFTETVTRTPSETPLPTPTSTSSATLTPLPSATFTETVTRTPSETPLPTLTSTSSATLTPLPSATFTETVTRTPSETPLPTPTSTSSATLTPLPSATFTETVTRTPSETPLPTPTATDIPPTEVVAAIIVTETRSPLPTATLTLTVTPTPTTTLALTHAPSDTATHTATSMPAAPASADDDDSSGLAIEALVGGLALLGIVGYSVLYLRGLAMGERYADGFVIERCPVCQTGHLSVEVRQTRLMGIPHSRYTVRCNNCHSTLREVGPSRWRYAVDGHINPAMFERFNGHEITERNLELLDAQPVSPDDRSAADPPSFIDSGHG